MEIFNSVFMQRAFAAGILIALITPCIGIIAVSKRLSTIGEALSHTSLAGVAAGLLLGINPVISAVVVCIVAALCIEGVRKKLPTFSEMSTVIIMSAGLGLAGVLSGYVKTSANFNSFLFGSIVSVSRTEMILTAVVSAVVVLSFVLFYNDFFYVVFDERAARLSGVKVGGVNFLFTMLTAITVSVAVRIAGALIVSSLMVIPVACAMQFNKSFKKTFVFAVLFSLGFTLAGLFMSYYIDGLRTGGTIVLVGIAVFVIILCIKKVSASVTRKRRTFPLKKQ